jgi:sulfatase maturation enzyme AslB (radical SAM superfamily)
VQITGQKKPANMSDLFLKIHDQLPVFAVESDDFTVLYTPGFFWRIKTVPVHELLHSLKNPQAIKNPEDKNAILSILKLAQEAVTKWELQKQIPFSPDCLTIHVGSDCQLNCSYCYSKAGGTDNKLLFGFPDIAAIETLFRYIGETKAKNSEPFTVVYHGSGEPTFHWKNLVDSYNTISTIAGNNGLQIFTYIATNGCLTYEQIDWLAENMDLIGISCDGPDAIRQKQRTSGTIQYPSIEEVCVRILEKGGKFENRVTITPDTLPHFEEIVSYLILECMSQKIRIEPVFLDNENGFKVEDAEEFLKRFTSSLNYAEKYGVDISYAGVRMDEQHGTYCDVQRNTLRLTVDNVTRNCFCFMSDDTFCITGKLNKDLSAFHLSNEIQDLKTRSLQIPENCNDCINIYHCSRGCPDHCILNDHHYLHQELNPFRCRLHQLIAVERVKYSAINHTNLC